MLILGQAAIVHCLFYRCCSVQSGSQSSYFLFVLGCNKYRQALWCGRPCRSPEILICHAAEIAHAGAGHPALPLTVQRARYAPYALPLNSRLTTGATDCCRRGFLLQLTCSLPGGLEARGRGEVAPLAGLLPAAWPLVS